MDKIFTIIRQWLVRLLETESLPDELDTLSIRDYADLPVVHPVDAAR
jgi:hypothetical protein